MDIDKIIEAAGENLPVLTAAAGATFLLLAILLIVVRRLTRRRRRPEEPPPDLDINVASLSTLPPPLGGAKLYYFNVPVRLAAIALAPAGRVRQLPPPEELAGLLDAVFPGLAEIVSTHAPLVRHWPPQLSARGFAHAFFKHAKLPGRGGRGTHWCSGAGILKVDDQPVMIGLVMHTERPTNIGQRIVLEEAQWFDLLRIRTD